VKGKPDPNKTEGRKVQSFQCGAEKGVGKLSTNQTVRIEVRWEGGEKTNTQGERRAFQVGEYTTKKTSIGASRHFHGKGKSKEKRGAEGKKGGLRTHMAGGEGTSFDHC